MASHPSIRTSIALALGATLSLSGAAFAVDGVKGYVVDDRGQVVKTTYGECVHTGAWNPSLAIAECDAEFAAMEKKPAPVTEAKADIDPAPMPTIEPQAKAEDEPMQTLQTVTMNSKTLFEFDSATLLPEAETKLDEIAGQIDSYEQVTEVEIRGYADRIGSEDYNEQLSERRAQAVSDYLQSKTSRSNFSVRALGEGHPVVNCENTGSRQALIQCLEPNRRVEIEVSAKKYQPTSGTGAASR